MAKQSDSIEELRVEIAAVLEAELGADQRAGEVAERIVRRLQIAFGCERIYIPGTSREERRRVVLDAWRDGAQPQEIARKHGVPIRTVYHIIRHRNRQSSGDTNGLGSEDWVL